MHLFARSDIETANLFEAKISFPKDLVEVKEIQTKSSFITNWAEEYYDNKTGEISLVGGVPNPGFQTQTGGGQSGFMATIVFKAKAIGKGSISFKDSSAIYSNTNNIDILTIKRPYDISVEVKPSPKPTPVSAPISTLLGSCTIRDSYTNLPVYSAVNVGTGYAKYNLGSVTNLADAKTKCTDAIYNTLMTNYCSTNKNPVQWGVATYVNQNNLIGSSSTCAASGCDNHSCPISPQPTPVPGTGDGNNDGKIDLKDLSVLLSDLPSEKGFRKAIDMNGDGGINSFDYSLMLELLIQKGVIRRLSTSSGSYSTPAYSTPSYATPSTYHT